MAAFQNGAAGDDAVGTLLARQSRDLLHPIERKFAGPPVDGKDGAIACVVDGVIAPRTLGDFPAINLQDGLEFAAAERDDFRAWRICPRMKGYGSAPQPRPRPVF